MIEILAPGPLATVQDLGRVGYYNIGVGRAGAMDPLALVLANRLAGNDDATACIEFTIGNFEICFHQDAIFALAGADCGARLDDLDVPAFWRMKAAEGQTLRAGVPRHGMRTYFTIAGGFALQPVLGSCSTDLKGGFGGLAGRALQPGDRLSTAPSTKDTGDVDFGIHPAALAPFYTTDLRDETTVRYMAAAEYDTFTDDAHKTFECTPWKIQPASNRIGYRLSGPVLELEQKLELRSHGILSGTIQVPPSGQPVIQLADANTCGGYPKFGVVIAADLWRLGQARLGGKLRFVQVSRDQALEALRVRNTDMEVFFAWLEKATKGQGREKVQTA